MSGKKFVLYFAITVAVSGAIAAIWMKKSYDSRPQIPELNQSVPKN